MAVCYTCTGQRINAISKWSVPAFYFTSRVVCPCNFAFHFAWLRLAFLVMTVFARQFCLFKTNVTVLLFSPSSECMAMYASPSHLCYPPCQDGGPRIRPHCPLARRHLFSQCSHCSGVICFTSSCCRQCAAVQSGRGAAHARWDRTILLAHPDFPGQCCG